MVLYSGLVVTVGCDGGYSMAAAAVVIGNSPVIWTASEFCITGSIGVVDGEIEGDNAVAATAGCWVGVCIGGVVGAIGVAISSGPCVRVASAYRVGAIFGGVAPCAGG